MCARNEKYDSAYNEIATEQSNDARPQHKNRKRWLWRLFPHTDARDDSSDRFHKLQV